MRVDRNVPKTRRAFVSRAAGRAVSLISICVTAGLSLEALPAQATTVAAAPRASAMATSSTTWIVLPMGHLDQPDNTFWELFSRTAASDHWSLVTPPGVADNGGLTLAPGATPSSGIVGVGASANLAFSPIAQSPDGGRSWSPGVLPVELSTSIDNVATGAGGAVYALTASRDSILSAADVASSSWAQVPSPIGQQVVAQSGRCAVSSVTSIAVGAGHLFAAGECAGGRGGALFMRSDGRWLAVTGFGDAVIWRLVGQQWGVSGLSIRDAAGRWSLSAFRFDVASRVVARSAPYVAKDPVSIESTASLASGGYIALVDEHGARVPVEFVSASSTWRQLPALPAGASEIAVSADGSADSFAASGATLHIFHLDAVDHLWKAGQSIAVPISYGSSS